MGCTGVGDVCRSVCGCAVSCKGVGTAWAANTAHSLGKTIWFFISMYLYLCAYVCRCQILISFILIFSHLHLSQCLVVLGLGQLCTSLAFEMPQGNEGNMLPKGATVTAPCHRASGAAMMSPACQPVTSAVTVGGCLQVQRGQHWAHWAEQSHHGLSEPSPGVHQELFARTLCRWEHTWQHTLSQAGMWGREPREVPPERWQLTILGC